MTPELKLEIVLQYLSGEKSEAELRRFHGIRSNKTIHNWVARLKASARVIFEDKRGASPRNPAKLPPCAPLAPPQAVNSDQAYAHYTGSDDDDYDPELAALFGVRNEDIEEMERTRLLGGKVKPKSNAESKRGRPSLKRSVERSLRRNKATLISEPSSNSGEPGRIKG